VESSPRASRSKTHAGDRFDPVADFRNHLTEGKVTVKQERQPGKSPVTEMQLMSMAGPLSAPCTSAPIPSWGPWKQHGQLPSRRPASAERRGAFRRQQWLVYRNGNCLQRRQSWSHAARALYVLLSIGINDYVKGER